MQRYRVLADGHHQRAVLLEVELLDSGSAGRSRSQTMSSATSSTRFHRQDHAFPVGAPPDRGDPGDEGEIAGVVLGRAS